MNQTYVMNFKNLIPDSIMIYMSLIIGVFAVVFRVILWWTVVIFGLRVLILMILKTPK